MCRAPDAAHDVFCFSAEHVKQAIGCSCVPDDTPHTGASVIDAFVAAVSTGHTMAVWEEDQQTHAISVVEICAALLCSCYTLKGARTSPPLAELCNP